MSLLAAAGTAKINRFRGRDPRILLAGDVTDRPVPVRLSIPHALLEITC